MPALALEQRTDYRQQTLFILEIGSTDPKNFLAENLKPGRAPKIIAPLPAVSPMPVTLVFDDKAEVGKAQVRPGDEGPRSVSQVHIHVKSGQTGFDEHDPEDRFRGRLSPLTQQAKRRAEPDSAPTAGPSLDEVGKPIAGA